MNVNVNVNVGFSTRLGSACQISFKFEFSDHQFETHGQGQATTTTRVSNQRARVFMTAQQIVCALAGSFTAQEEGLRARVHLCESIELARVCDRRNSLLSVVVVVSLAKLVRSMHTHTQ